MQAKSTDTDTLQVSRVEYQALRQENAYLKEELAQLKKLIFGKKNERFIPSDSAQSQLDFGQPINEVEPEAEQQTVSYTREKKADKKKAVRLALPAHLPREEEILEPEDKQEDAVKLGDAITEILEYTPGKVYVKRYVRPKYVQSTENEDKKQILVAPLPTMPIPNGNIGAGLLAHLLISKYVDHLPFYRQVQIFKREGLKLAESTVSGWFKAACKLLEPLYYELMKQVLSSGYIMADETPIPVQSSNKPGATHTGYMWVYRAPEKGMVIFDYQQSRGAQGPEGVLEGFSGALQTDGYKAYNQFEKKPGIILLACMAHVRRKFDQARENDPRRAEYALTEIQKLYALERQCKEENLDTDQVKTVRQKYALPVLTSLKHWMEQQYPGVAPKSKIGIALAYTLKLWPRIVRYTENGSWNIDNNLVENSIRPVALGRKNYLFAGSHDAAQWAAMLYSFLATCKAREVEPFQWLKRTIEVMPDAKVNDLADLIPGNQ